MLNMLSDLLFSDKIYRRVLCRENRSFSGSIHPFLQQPCPDKPGITSDVIIARHMRESALQDTVSFARRQFGWWRRQAVLLFLTVGVSVGSQCWNDFPVRILSLQGIVQAFHSLKGSVPRADTELPSFSFALCRPMRAWRMGGGHA